MRTKVRATNAIGAPHAACVEERLPVYEVIMPKLSDSMAVGKIIEWKVSQGDAVREGDVLAEVESDKAVMELECFRDGVVAKIVHADGDEAAVGEAIAYIGEAGEEAPSEAPAAKPATEPQAPAEPASTPPPAPTPQPPAPAPAPPRAADGSVRISPYAKKLALERGIDYTAIQGSGPGGRIIAADVEAAKAGASAPTQAETPAPEPAVRPPADEELPPVVVTEEEADVEDAPFRLKTQARIVVAAKHVIPHFYVTRSVDVTELMERKAHYKEQHAASVTHMVMRACLKALEQHPEINRSYDRGRIIKWKAVNLGLAIGTDQGLTVAVLKRANELSFKELVERILALVEKARAGKLSTEERQHATFTISSLGMFDVEQFEPIVNPPSAVTLGVASALPAPVVRGDAIFFGQLMRITASCDHRIIDGIAAAKFLNTVRLFLEDPDKLL